MYNEGISRVGDILDLATELDIVDKHGSWYSYGDIRLGQGRENSKEFLQQNEDLVVEIKKAVHEQAMIKSPATPWSDTDDEEYDDGDESVEDEE
jgi:recombination protein RecA